jgi:hypothetical protein
MSQRYGSGPGSGSFCHQAKYSEKHWFLLFCDFCVTFIFEKWCKCTFLPSKICKQKTQEKIKFLLKSWRTLTKISGFESRSGSICQRYGSTDPDPYQNFMDPQKWVIPYKSRPVGQIWSPLASWDSQPVLSSTATSYVSYIYRYCKVTAERNIPVFSSLITLGLFTSPDIRYSFKGTVHWDGSGRNWTLSIGCH